MKTKEELERLATELGDAAYTVPLALGPGLLESAYQTCLVHELRKRGFEVRCEVPFPVLHDGLALDAGYRVDLLLEDQIIVENKAVHATAPIHEAHIPEAVRPQAWASRSTGTCRASRTASSEW